MVVGHKNSPEIYFFGLVGKKLLGHYGGSFFIISENLFWNILNFIISYNCDLK